MLRRLRWLLRVALVAVLSSLLVPAAPQAGLPTAPVAVAAPRLQTAPARPPGCT